MRSEPNTHSGSGITGTPSAENTARQSVGSITAEINQSEVSDTNTDSGNTAPAQDAQKPVIPAGMPQFSALSGNGSASEGQNSGAGHPFYNGGTLPPQQSAETLPSERITENASGIQNGSTIQGGTKISPAPSNNSSYSEQDWSDSYAPDDTSPDENEDYEYAENEVEQEAQDIEQEQTETESSVNDADEYALPENPVDIHESSVTFSAPDGSSITMGKLFGSVIAELKVDNAGLGAALMNTGRWELSGNKITASIGAEYQKNFIEREKSKILSIINRYCRAEMQFEITLEEKSANDKPAELPLQVKILCNTFKGTPIGV